MAVIVNKMDRPVGCDHERLTQIVERLHRDLGRGRDKST